jgi:hypothetical protein
MLGTPDKVKEKFATLLKYTPYVFILDGKESPAWLF